MSNHEISISNYRGTWYAENEEGEEWEIKLPMQWEICDYCRGNGTCLPEGMKGHAYTAEEFDRDFDHDEQARYMSGGYDVCCPACNGTGKLQEVNFDACTPDVQAALRAYYADEAAYQAECAAERRMGC